VAGDTVSELYDKLSGLTKVSFITWIMNVRIYLKGGTVTWEQNGQFYGNNILCMV